jgi:hypothetical protein
MVTRLYDNAHNTGSKLQGLKLAVPNTYINEGIHSAFSRLNPPFDEHENGKKSTDGEKTTYMFRSSFP